MTGSDHTILKVLPAYCKDYKLETPPAQSLPPSLQDLYQPASVGLPLEELQEICKKIEIKVTQEEIRLIEEKTRQQSKIPVWFLARAGRVTASNLHAACHTNPLKPARSLIRKICYPEKEKCSSPAVEWGIKNESQAREKYISVIKGQHTDFNIRNSGLNVSAEYPFMGASPDAIVHCFCHKQGCVEIKCPYGIRNETVSHASNDSSFFLDNIDGHLSLKINHPYYSQCQAQMFLTNSLYCDLVVWTTVDMSVVRLLPNQAFWDECVEKAKRLFTLAILPELVGRWMDQGSGEEDNKGSKNKTQQLFLSHNTQVTQNQPEPVASVAETETTGKRKRCADKTDANYCFCQQPEHGRMVACDNENCVYEWFHYDCVGVKRKPKGAWYCYECKPHQ